MRVVAFDLETTGTDPAKDRIVEICLAPVGEAPRTIRVDPGVPIPEAATRVHGIRDEDVRGLPRFAHVAADVQRAVADAVLLGYNSRSFDTPLLDAELKRAGQRGLDLDALREIDVMRVWNAVEPRTLAGAAQRWLGAAHETAHSAEADAVAALAVWSRIAETAGLTAEAGIRLTKPANEVDRAGKFAIDEAGRVVLTFGKHQGKPVNSVDPAYLVWMSENDFPSSTKAVIARLIEHKGDLPEAAAYRKARGLPG